jgi:glycosyltransferase involved in cell wall biosynthesis
MRVRILEAFAQAMPVVTTTIGLEGIEASPDEDVLVADTPSDFAARVVKVLSDETLQNRLAMNGRRLVEKCYDWRAVLQKLDSIYESIHIGD